MRAVPIVHKTLCWPLSEDNPFKKRHALLLKKESELLNVGMSFSVLSLFVFAVLLSFNVALFFSLIVFVIGQGLGLYFKMQSLKYSGLIKRRYQPLKPGDFIFQNDRVFVIERVGFKTYYLIELKSYFRKTLSFSAADKTGYYIFPTPKLLLKAEEAFKKA